MESMKGLKSTTMNQGCFIGKVNKAKWILVAYVSEMNIKFVNIVCLKGNKESFNKYYNKKGLQDHYA